MTARDRPRRVLSCVNVADMRTLRTTGDNIWLASASARLGITAVAQPGDVQQDPRYPQSGEASFDRRQLDRRYVLKYFASGWWTTMASVDCSGCSWNSS